MNNMHILHSVLSFQRNKKHWNFLKFYATNTAFIIILINIKMYKPRPWKYTGIFSIGFNVLVSITSVLEIRPIAYKLNLLFIAMQIFSISDNCIEYVCKENNIE